MRKHINFFYINLNAKNIWVNNSHVPELSFSSPGFCGSLLIGQHEHHIRIFWLSSYAKTQGFQQVLANSWPILGTLSVTVLESTSFYLPQKLSASEAAGTEVRESRCFAGFPKWRPTLHIENFHLSSEERPTVSWVISWKRCSWCIFIVVCQAQKGIVSPHQIILETGKAKIKQTMSGEDQLPSS